MEEEIMKTAEPLLLVKNLTKQFPGTTALDEMDFDLSKGEVHAVVGEHLV